MAAVAADGTPVISWTGLRLRDVGPTAESAHRPAVLLAPYLTRSIRTVLPDAGLRLSVTPSRGRGAERPGDQGLDGSRSRSHLADLVLTASADTGVACDWEQVIDDAELNRTLGLLPWPGVAAELGGLVTEPATHTATRLWTVLECLSRPVAVAVLVEAQS